MSEAAAPDAARPAPGVARILPDERLARRAAAGDERAFGAIFDRYHQRLYRYCLAIVGDAQDAQDALQNTMVKVLRALPGEERRIELKPWLYRIAHNESVELIRRRRETRELDAELAAPGHGLAAEVASRQRLRQLISDLDELPERQRGALVMRELAGLDFAEIGAALGTSPAVARQTLYEARLGLKQMDEGRDLSCEKVTRALSDGDGRVLRRRDLRAHLRTCADCRRFREEIEGRQRGLAALAPLPAVAAAGLLHGLLGGHAGGSGGLAAGLGGGAAKTLGGSAALKGAATVAVVAAIGVGAADRGGLIDAGLPGGGGSHPTQNAPAAGPGRTPGQAIRAVHAAPAAAENGAAGVRGGAGLGAAQAKKATTADPAQPEGGGTEEVASAPAVQDTPATPAHGRGQKKTLPAASAHGQETAAAHKAVPKGPAGSQGQPSHPPKPSHPPHPATPSTGKGTAPAAAPGGRPEAHAPTPAAPPAAAAEEASPGHEAGKKP